MFVIYKILRLRSAINFAAKKLLPHFFLFILFSKLFQWKILHLGKSSWEMCSIYQVLWLHFELSATHSLLLFLSISFSLSFCPKFAWYANLFRLVFVLFFNTYFCVNFIALPTLNTKLDTVKCFDYFCDKISQLRPIVRVSRSGNTSQHC